MDKVKISVVIPVYNAEEWLDRCLCSVLSQRFMSYEVILVDDGSTDSSPLICDRYSSTDSLFRTIHKKNGGVSSARNAGMNMSKGEYVMFLDSDDALFPDAMESLASVADGADFVMGGYRVFISGIPDREVIPSRRRRYDGDEMAMFFDDNIRRNCETLDAPWAKMFRRKSIGDLQFCESLSYAEDKLFVFSFLASAQSASVCSKPVYAYHLRSGSLGSDVESDRHLIHLRRFLPAYADTIQSLSTRYSSSEKLQTLYHKDVIARYVCRILNIFMTRRTALLTDSYLSWVYGLMYADERLGIFSIRPGQVFNILLYRFGNIGFSISVYRLLSSVVSFFKVKRK